MWNTPQQGDNLDTKKHWLQQDQWITLVPQVWEATTAHVVAILMEETWTDWTKVKAKYEIKDWASI